MAIKKNLNSKIASLLVKLQDRLNRVRDESSQTAAAVLALQDSTRLKIGKLQQDAERESTLNHSRALAQTDSLVKLRESTAKAFDQVKADVESLLKLNQRLNERVSALESARITLAKDVVDAGARKLIEIDRRILAVEANANEALEFKRELRRIVNVATDTNITDLWKN